ncbi:MAG: hypothetical protein E6J90_01720 [Deltaproteobacteria bacterium]|nr:MAG: hypothetical protein E6J90_01720 [Deltaproteobacteria bacterium]
MQMAFEDRDGDGQWFLDLETGEAVRVNEHDDDELGEQIEAGFGERYLRIPYQGSDAAYRDMEEFIDSVTDDRCRGLLDVAIRGEGAFRPGGARTLVRISKAARPRPDRRWLEDEYIEPVARQPSSG